MFGLVSIAVSDTGVRIRGMAIGEQEIRSGTLEELAQTVTAAEKAEAIHAVQSAPEVTFTWDYERSRAAAVEAVREGQDVAVERHHRHRLEHRRRRVGHRP